MKTRKQQKPAESKKAGAGAIANAAVGAVVGGIIAGPAGAIVGAAVGAMVEKGPAKSPSRRQPTAARPTDDQPSSSGKHRPPASRKKPAGKASRRKPRTTIAPPLAGAGPDVRINRARRK